MARYDRNDYHFHAMTDAQRSMRDRATTKKEGVRVSSILKLMGIVVLLTILWTTMGELISLYSKLT